MDRFRRQVRIEAPLAEVFAFHSKVEGLLAVTPGWMNLRHVSSRGPGGETDPDPLEAGSTVVLSTRPFGVGPRTRWTSRIVEREREADRAMFRDVMVDGPFPHWVHVHRFEAEDGATILTDVVEYELPYAPRPLAPLGRPFLELLFAYRHRRTRRLLE